MSRELDTGKEAERDWKIWKTVMAGGRSGPLLQVKYIRKSNIFASTWAEGILWSKELFTLPQPEKINLVRIIIRDLGFIDNPTTKQIYGKLRESGLEPCPPDVIPKLTSGPDWVSGDSFFIGMKPVSPLVVNTISMPSILQMERSGEDGVWHLHAEPARPEDKWNLNSEFIFRLPERAQNP